VAQLTFVLFVFLLNEYMQGGSTPQIPIQNITDLIIRASQEQQLAQMEITYLPWM
jgi:hypothetical protein